LISEDEGEKRKDLNLQTNEGGLLECSGRIEENYPPYLPDAAFFSKKLVEREGTQSYLAWWNFAQNDDGETALLDSQIA
jgi:hypothetical protein